MSSKTYITIHSKNKQFLDSIEESGLDFGPTKEPFEKSEFMSEDQHKWRLKHWGCKWNITNIKRFPNQIQCVVPNSTIDAFINTYGEHYAISVSMVAINLEMGYREDISWVKGIKVLDRYEEE